MNKIIYHVSIVTAVAAAFFTGAGMATAKQNPGATVKTGAAAKTGTAFTVVSTNGDVSVRRGASEEWTVSVKGDVLKPDDSIRSGEGARAEISTPDGKRISLPASVIVDLSDLRPMSQEDLLLRLAADDLRSAPRKDSGDGIDAAKTTTTRGSEQPGPAGEAGKASKDGTATDAGTLGMLRLNGTEVLFANGYFGSCVLKTREVFKAEPALAADPGARIMIAEAFERLELMDEAYEAYEQASALKLSKGERSTVDLKMKEIGAKLEKGIE